MSTDQTKYLFYQRIIDFFWKHDIWTIAGGPNWEENYKFICETSYSMCQGVTIYANMVNDEAVPMKVLEHYAQNAVLYRTQLYVKDYFHTEEIRSRLIDPGMIDNKVAIWVGIWD